MKIKIFMMQLVLVCHFATPSCMEQSRHSNINFKLEFIQQWLSQLSVTNHITSAETNSVEKKTIKLPIIQPSHALTPPTSPMNDSFACPMQFCHRQFLTFELLKIHVKQSHDRYLCPCNQHFNNVHTFAMHYASCKEKAKT